LNVDKSGHLVRRDAAGNAAAYDYIEGRLVGVRAVVVDGHYGQSEKLQLDFEDGGELYRVSMGYRTGHARSIVLALAGVPLVELANVTGASVELTPTEYYATLKLAEEHGWKRAGASNDRHAADSLHRAEGYDAVGAVLTAEDVSGLVAALKAARPVLATGEPVNELPASVRQLARICELHDSRRRFGDGWLRLLIPEVVSHAVR
jgi:hypothetical protein